MFGMPQGPGKGVEEGASREHPILLEGVKAPDFAALLKMLHASRYSEMGLESEFDIIVPAFRLAHMWDFSGLRDYLVPLVKDALGPVDKVVLARELGLQEWLVPAYVELCRRKELPTKEEAAKLGMDSILMLFRLREEFRSSGSGFPSGQNGEYCTNCVEVSRSNGRFGGAPCTQCGGALFNGYHRITMTQSSKSPPNNDAGLADRVKKWVEGGCITE